MAISFEESRGQLLEQQTTAVALSLEDAVVAEDDDWTRHEDYVWFEDYYDDKFSTIDSDKNVFLHASQTGISQEVNSQFIPFEMPRRYDNIDLVKMAISIHYTTKDNHHGSYKPVNVQYNDEMIRFVWLVDENVTFITGDVRFEVHVNGAITDNQGNVYAYRWKSKPAIFTISESLCEGSDCEPVDVSDDWVVDIVESVVTVATDRAVNSIVDSEVDEWVQNTVDDALTWGTFGLQS